MAPTTSRAKVHRVRSSMPRADNALPRWSWWLAAAAFAQYLLAGWWLIAVRHYVIRDALSRTLSAKLMTLSRDPHLGAMGFYWMPLPTMLRMPFVLVLEPFGRAELAGPATSAFMAALTVPVLVAIGRVLKLSTAVTVLLVCLYALSPVTVFLGANGMSETCSGLFLAITLLGFLRWRHDGRMQSLVLAGLGLAGSAMSRYETVVLMPIVAVAVALCVENVRRRDAVTVVLLPTVLVFGWWMLASRLIVGDWLYFYHVAKTVTALPPDPQWLPTNLGFGSILAHGVTVVLVLAPALVAVIVGSALAWRRWRTSLFLLGMAVAIPAFIVVQVARGASWGVPRFFMLSPLMAVVGVMWIIRTGLTTPANRVVGAAGIGLVAIGAITGTVFLSSQTNAYAEGEFAFFAPLIGREQAYGSVDFDGSNRVFIGDLRPFRQLKRDLDPFLADGDVAVMDSLQAVPVLLTDYPRQFIVPEDRDFEEVLSDPIGRFDFIVIQNGTAMTVYRQLIDSALAITEGGIWKQVADYNQQIVVYEWVANGSQPTFS